MKESAGYVQLDNGGIIDPMTTRSALTTNTDKACLPEGYEIAFADSLELSRLSSGGNMLTYQILEIADPADMRHQSAADGDVRVAVFAAGEHLLRQLANIPSGLISAEFLFVFQPDAGGSDRQARLRLYLRLWASDDLTAKTLSQLIERGGLSIYYHLKRVDGQLDDLTHLSASCDIVRRQVLIEPLHGPEFNANVPNLYYAIVPFAPNTTNDFILLDRILDGVDEPVLISLRIQPADISQERRAMTALMERLHSINHSWHSGGDDCSEIDYFGDDQRYAPSNRGLQPLTMRDPVADDISRSLRAVHQSLCEEPHLFFSIRAIAVTEAVVSLVGSTFAECAFEEGTYQIVVSRKGEGLFDNTVGFDCESELAPAPAHLHLRHDQDVREHSELYRLAQLATVDELSGAFRLPVASFSSPLCIRRNTDPVHEEPNDIIVLGFDDQGIEGNSNPVQRGIHVELLKKHMSVFGVSGMGKTTSNINVLLQLRAKGIPFMVIETAKKDYRVIKMLGDSGLAHCRQLAEELEVYTVGEEACSPLRLNPLEILPGISRDAHIENLLGCFMGVMAIFPALPGILGEAMEDIYEAHPNIKTPPIIADLFATSMKVLARKGYSAEVNSNITGALDNRLGGLTRRIAGTVFQCRHSIPSIDHFMSSYSVLELDILSGGQKCLITLFLLNWIREYLKSVPSTNRLRYVVLVEESHNIFGPSGDAKPSEEAPDPKAHVADVLSTMLVELRSLGVGIILSDQHPKSLDTTAVKSTSTKLAFRQVYGAERQELAESMLLPEVEAVDLARLGPGQAYLYREGYFRSIRIRTPNLHSDLNLPVSPSDEELLAIIRGEEWFERISLMRTVTELDQFKEYLDEFEQERVAVMDRLSQLQRCYQYVLKHLHNRLSKRRLPAIKREALRLKKHLVSMRESFRRCRHSTYLVDGSLSVDDSDVKSYASQLESRFRIATGRGMNSVLTIIDKLIQNCRSLLQTGV